MPSPLKRINDISAGLFTRIFTVVKTTNTIAGNRQEEVGVSKRPWIDVFGTSSRRFYYY